MYFAMDKILSILVDVFRAKKGPARHARAGAAGGFTLIETLVSITLLLLAVGGPMWAVSQSLSSAMYARDQITAFYLAQDAIEYIRNVRDNTALTGGTITADNWLGVLSPYVNGVNRGNTFSLDTTVDSSDPNAIHLCSGSCSPLKFDVSTGQYGNTSGSDSPFTRSVTFKTDDNTHFANEVQVEVDITWRQNIASAKHEFKVVENLTNWVK